MLWLIYYVWMFVHWVYYVGVIYIIRNLMIINCETGRTWCTLLSVLRFVHWVYYVGFLYIIRNLMIMNCETSGTWCTLSVLHIEDSGTGLPRSVLKFKANKIIIVCYTFTYLLWYKLDIIMYWSTDSLWPWCNWILLCIDQLIHYDPGVDTTLVG
jgi:hypothetical protein